MSFGSDLVRFEGKVSGMLGWLTSSGVALAISNDSWDFGA
jgi:hypothetical protein